MNKPQNDTGLNRTETQITAYPKIKRLHVDARYSLKGEIRSDRAWSLDHLVKLFMSDALLNIGRNLETKRNKELITPTVRIAELEKAVGTVRHFNGISPYPVTFEFD